MCEVDVVNFLFPSIFSLLSEKVQQLVTTGRTLINISGTQVVVVQFFTVFVPAGDIRVPTASWDGMLHKLNSH